MFQIWVWENLRLRKSNERKIIWKIFLTWWKKNWTKIIPSIRIFQTQTFELLLKEGNWKCNNLFEERKACDPLIFPCQLGSTRAWRGASLVAQRLKHLPAMWETWVRSLGWEDPLEKEMATHSSILAWRIPWMEEPGGLQSARSQSRTQPSDLTHSELGEKTAYKASRRCCGGFRKVKAKDFDVKSQELFKQDWLFSRRDATVCRDIPVAALKGQDCAQAQRGCSDAPQHVGLSCSFTYILSHEDQGQKLAVSPDTITRSPNPDFFGCSHWKSIYLWQIYLVQRGTFLAGKTNSWR